MTGVAAPAKGGCRGSGEEKPAAQKGDLCTKGKWLYAFAGKWRPICRAHAPQTARCTMNEVVPWLT